MAGTDGRDPPQVPEAVQEVRGERKMGGSRAKLSHRTDVYSQLDGRTFGMNNQYAKCES